MSGTVALRTALVWHDEVMSDVVIDKPRAITLGSEGKTTFVVPDIGLPAKFAIVRPGNRGYLLTLGERMRGTICIDGKRRTGRASSSKATRDARRLPRDADQRPRLGRDRARRDRHGKLFFQFVPLEENRCSSREGDRGRRRYVPRRRRHRAVEPARRLFDDEARVPGVGSARSRSRGPRSSCGSAQDNETKVIRVLDRAARRAARDDVRLYTGEDPFAWPGRAR